MIDEKKLIDLFKDLADEHETNAISYKALCEVILQQPTDGENMRVYISGPMTGVENYKENFKRAEEELIARGYQVANPAYIDQLLPFAEYEEYMKVDMCLLDLCDAIYLLDGWKNSCGANREYGYALARDYIVLMEGK